MRVPNAIPVDDSEDDEDVRIIASPHRKGHNEALFCMFCNVDLNKYTPEDRQRHYDDHLSALDTLPPPSSSSRPRSQPSRVKSSPTKGISFFNTTDKDRFWYHSLEIEPPSNYTPGLIPLLRKVLLDSVEKGATRRAVLCYERAVHIYHEMWDAGWGCGYRNFMMLSAALVDQHMKPQYPSLLTDPTPPGVNNLKIWIEEAWKSGFDPEGAKEFKGKLVGRKKWIGTAELYVAFTYRGIPSQLADFNTPNGNMTSLLDWTKQYFDAHTQDKPTSVQERWRGATPVVITDRMPLILQHQGHSRTIVGYEIARDGSTILLAFDPSARMTQIRNLALSSFNPSSQRGTRPTDSKHSSPRRHLADSLKSPLQSHNKRAGPSADGGQSGSPKRLRAGSIGEDVIIVEASSATASPSRYPPEHHDRGHRAMTERETDSEKVGKSKDEKTLDPRKVLKLFRVDQKKLAKKKKYQALWCPMEDPLTESDKQARREVTSDHVC